MEPTITNGDRDHAESVFKNSSVSPPRDPRTNQPVNQFQRPYVYRNGGERQEFNCPCEFTIHGSSPRRSTVSDYHEEGDESKRNIFDEELQSCNDLLAEVESLRSDYRCNVDILQKLFENQKKLNDLTASLLNNCEQTHPEGLEVEGLETLHGCGEDNTFVSSSNTTIELVDEESAPTHSSPEASNVDSTSNGSHSDGGSNDSFDLDESSDAFVSPGLEAIESMWDNFSVDEYVPYSTWTTSQTETGTIERPHLKPWQPRITIPKPFTMTLREEKKERKKSRSLLQAEREWLEKEALEQAELSKSFRANPIPATTYLPLYQMINAQQERRRKHVKGNSQKILKAKERPFSFFEREMKKLSAKEKEISDRVEQEYEKMSSDMFKAKPIPRNVLDPNIDEKLKENEEYRRIRIRMRALELLASSQLPNRMRFHADSKYTIGQLRKLKREELGKLAFLTAEHSFHPEISGDVPDYKQAYEDFQKQLNAKKREGDLLTVTQPFTHRTDSRIKQRQSKKCSLNDSSVQPPLKSSKATPTISKSCLKDTSSSYTAPQTRSAQLRHQATQHRLFKQEEEPKIRKGSDSDQKKLQREVSQRSIVNDVSFAMDVQRRERLRNLRQRDQENSSIYRHQLDEMQQRVNRRPFLFERDDNEAEES